MTPRQSTTILLALLGSLAASATGFVHLAPAATICSGRRSTVAVHAAMTTIMSGSGDARVTRSEALQRAVAGSGVLAASALVLEPHVAAAVVEPEKDAVQQFDELKGELTRKKEKEEAKESLVNLTDATVALKTLDFYIGEKDYQSLRTAMRRPPIVYLRASARKVILAMDNEVEAKRTQAAYTALISSVDKMDGVANKGIKEKGGLKDIKELVDAYDVCVERGSALLELLPASS